jgi:TolB-like protein/Tfp pilus assembly protein PilF
VVIFGLIILNVIPRSGKKEILDKSIAVLPFTSLSEDPEKQYQADGVMDAILLHLSKIEDLRVMARTSVEQYRGTTKTAADICNELNVAYLLEGSFQKYGDHARLIVQLIQSGVEGHVWANNYDREWKDIFTVQSEVAQLVAKELQAAITPEEKQIIDKIPTANLTAYDFYQRGRADHERFWSDWDNREALERAEDFYYKALEYDSTFALAYTGLALVYWTKRGSETYFMENYLDSVLILADKALSFDNQLSDAFQVKGSYYHAHNKNEQAIIEYDKAIKYNPNNWMAYFGKSRLYSSENDYKNSIENYYKAASLYRGLLLPNIYRSLANMFAHTGFIKTAEKYAKEAFALDDDSALYYSRLAQYESDNGNYKTGIEFYKRAFAIDSNRSGGYIIIGNDYTYLGQFEKALMYYKKSLERFQDRDQTERRSAGIMIRLGQTYLNIGKEEEASYYLNRALELIIEEDQLDRSPRFSEIIQIHTRALLYACLGDKDKFFEHLRLLNQKQHIPVWLVSALKIDPAFNSIRDEPEFQQIMDELESKYQAEHERVRQWLEENDML